MNPRRVPAALRVGLVAVCFLAAACGDDDGGGASGGGGLAALVTTTTEAETTTTVEETTTTTSGGGGLFSDGGTGQPGSGIFSGDVGSHDIDPGAITDIDRTDPSEFYGSADIDVDKALALYDACAGGDMQACDTMYLDTPVGTAAEAFGATCGGELPEADVYCVTLTSGTTGSYVPLGTPYTLGFADDTEEALVNACHRGGMQACDALYVWSDQSSPAFAYGAQCGGRVETNNYCSDLYSLGYDYHQAWLAANGLI